MLTAKQVVKKFHVHRYWLSSLTTLGILSVDRRIEKGRAKNYYDEKQIKELLSGVSKKHGRS
jgi:hypothetical protein